MAGGGKTALTSSQPAPQTRVVNPSSCTAWWPCALCFFFLSETVLDLLLGIIKLRIVGQLGRRQIIFGRISHPVLPCTRPLIIPAELCFRLIDGHLQVFVSPSRDAEKDVQLHESGFADCIWKDLSSADFLAQTHRTYLTVTMRASTVILLQHAHVTSQDDRVWVQLSVAFLASVLASTAEHEDEISPCIVVSHCWTSVALCNVTNNTSTQSANEWSALCSDLHLQKRCDTMIDQARVVSKRLSALGSGLLLLSRTAQQK